MDHTDYADQYLCKKCFIKLCRPTKDEIRRIIFTEYKDQCEKCGRKDFIVDYIEEK